MMTRLSIGRLGWLASIALLTAILLLATRIDIATWTVRESAQSGHLAALVTCVLPATADDPATTPPDCESSAPDQVRAAWMTAC